MDLRLFLIHTSQSLKLDFVLFTLRYFKILPRRGALGGDPPHMRPLLFENGHHDVFIKVLEPLDGPWISLLLDQRGE